MRIEELARILNRKPGHVRRMLIRRGYLRQNGNPSTFSINNRLIREDGFIYRNGRDLFIQELGIRENPHAIDENEDFIVEEAVFQRWINNTIYDYRYCENEYRELCRRWQINSDDHELQNQCLTKLRALFQVRYGVDYDEEEYYDDPIEVFINIIGRENADLGEYFQGLFEQLNDERIREENNRQYWNDWAAQITNDDGYDSDNFFEN